MIEHHEINASRQLITTHDPPVHGPIDVGGLGAGQRAHLGAGHRMATHPGQSGARDAHVRGAPGIGRVIRKAAFRAQSEREATVEIRTHPCLHKSAMMAS